jgi:hypothetical protein
VCARRSYGEDAIRPSPLPGGRPVAASRRSCSTMIKRRSRSAFSPRCPSSVSYSMARVEFRCDAQGPLPVPPVLAPRPASW